MNTCRAEHTKTEQNSITAPEKSAGRIRQLDILRGIAILLVLGRHPAVPVAESGWLYPLVFVWNRFGWTGVDLFFVLSGFLIGGLLFKELRASSRLDIRRFIIRRGFKIWPAYYVFLAFAAIETVCIHRAMPHFSALREIAQKHPEYVDLSQIVPGLFHLQNYLGLIRLHTWSLAVEEHFYLALPFVLWLLTRKSRGCLNAIPALPWIAAGTLIVCTTLRFFPGAQLETGPWPIFYQTHLRIDSLFFGVLLAYFYHFAPDTLRRIARRRGLLLLLGLLLLSPMLLINPRGNWFVPTLGFPMLYVGYGCILLVLLHTPLDSGQAGRLLQSLPARSFAFIGVYSYSIYLWHVDLGRLPASLLYVRLRFLPPEIAWALGTGVYILLALTLGILLSKLIEMPVLRLRDRYFPARSVTIAAPVEETALTVRPVLLERPAALFAPEGVSTETGH